MWGWYAHLIYPLSWRCHRANGIIVMALTQAENYHLQKDREALEVERERSFQERGESTWEDHKVVGSSRCPLMDVICV